MDYQITQANQPLMPAYFQGRWAVKQIADRDVMYSTNLGAEIDFQVTDASFLRLTFLPLAYALIAVLVSSYTKNDRCPV